MAQSVCHLEVRAFFKQYCSLLLLSVGPFVGGLEKQVTQVYEQFLEGIPIWIPARGIFLAVSFCLLHFIVSLLYGIPTVPEARLLHGIAGRFPDMDIEK